jgi:hypothetical protein
MRTTVAAAILLSAFAATAQAQSNWDKSYNVSGKAAVQVDVDDASVKVRACGGCRAVHIHVDGQGTDLSRFRITELQGGDGIHFAMKHVEEHSFFGGGWHGHSPLVTIDTPTETTLALHSGDGSLSVAGLRGSVEAKTGDGSIQFDDVSGSLLVHTGDGSIHMNRTEGTLNASTGDGSMNIEGRFSQIDAHTGDGSANVSLLPGSHLSASSRVYSGDGSITVRVPRDLQADLYASSGDGSINCNIPLQTTVSSNDRHVVRGSMNGGGPTLRLQSGDGSISVSAQ